MVIEEISFWNLANTLQKPDGCGSERVISDISKYSKKGPLSAKHPPLDHGAPGKSLLGITFRGNQMQITHLGWGGGSFAKM